MAPRVSSKQQRDPGRSDRSAASPPSSSPSTGCSRASRGSAQSSGPASGSRGSPGPAPSTRGRVGGGSVPPDQGEDPAPGGVVVPVPGAPSGSSASSRATACLQLTPTGQVQVARKSSSPFGRRSAQLDRGHVRPGRTALDLAHHPGAPGLHVRLRTAPPWAYPVPRSKVAVPTSSSKTLWSAGLITGGRLLSSKGRSLHGSGPGCLHRTERTPDSRRAARALYCMAAMGCLGGYGPKVMKCRAIPLVKLSM